MFFSLEKRPFRNKNTSFTFNTKTRFSGRKEYFTSEIVFTVETSVFAEKNMQKFRVFFVGKDRFVIKIPVLTAKTTFSRRKEYFTSEIVFHSGSLSFCREKFVEISCFFSLEKRPFRNKNTSFNSENEVFS